MERRALGRTGLEVGEIGFGAWAISGRGYGATDDRESLRAIRRALELGVDFIDTADVYGDGRSERLIGRVLRERGDRKTRVATKFGWDFYGGVYRSNLRREYVEFALGESLKRLGREWIDLYQVHDSDPRALERSGVFETLERLKETGKIKAWGVSAHRVEDGIYAIRAGDPDVIQVAYNILQREAEDVLFPLALERGTGIIAREPLACGLITGKYNGSSTFPEGDHRRSWSREQLAEGARKVARLGFLATPERTLVQAAIRFALSHPAVSVVIPGAKTVEQVEENVGAAGVTLSGEELRKAMEAAGG
ncbi:MAG: aldo/keto reductase [Candidatus Methanosuratincola sp.]